MGNGHLLLVAVGPVQDFIAAGRKVRDIWYGSECLSELSKALAKHLFDKGCTLIFPAPIDPSKDLEPKSSFIVVNRIMVVVPADIVPSLLFEELKECICTFWKDRSADAKKQCQAEALIDDIRFAKQLNDLGEIYAVWTSYDGNYQEARAKVEQLMAARKCCRAFEAPTWDGTGLVKSSLDGIRETVLKTGADTKSHGRIRKNEHLDALGFIKRMGSFRDANKFDSLVEMAVRTYEAQLKAKPEMAGEYDALQEKAKNIFADNDARWPEPLYRGRLETLVRELEDSRREKAQPVLEKTIRFHKKYGEPENYLCFLLGDGDHMGRALDTLASVEEHQLFSRELSRFSREAREIVERHSGELIYSGGDDVMAYLPMHTALDCAMALREKFLEVMRVACGDIIVERPTFSAGLVITHHSESLAEIFAQARAAEQDAKERGGRDALAIYQNKRQHRGIHLAVKWNDLPARLQTFVRLHKDGIIPSRLGFQLRTVSTQCGWKLQWAGESPANAAAAELVRVLSRKDIKDEDSQMLRALLPKYDDVGVFSDELVVAQQFANSIAMAQGKSKMAKGGKE